MHEKETIMKDPSVNPPAHLVGGGGGGLGGRGGDGKTRHASMLITCSHMKD
jgi:hypothetical protein